jgi:hypothetical protein
MNELGVEEHALKKIYFDSRSFAEQEGKKILLSHFGTFSQDLVNGISASVEELLISGGETKKIVHRTFSILIEGLQNIFRHGALDDTGTQEAFVIVTRDPLEMTFVFGNLIRSEDSSSLRSYLDHINTLDKDQLTLLYLDVLSTGSVFSDGGSGLGCIAMRMKSESKLDYRLHPIGTDRVAFSVRVSLSKV